ncbi:hypothetical protein [Plantactinospora endophytica]|uniref:Uncharacterized protein n=1 Tax=Plantactinospora endophytica TaxID=673535 RepID=A0ABQ4EAH8_9ACTN|nr:hypothetical protein [Plantactinospora endophytica]GIG91732.1 hypothetical protein Pen02_66680 [Plantactinospora endophytica]
MTTGRLPERALRRRGLLGLFGAVATAGLAGGCTDGGGAARVGEGATVPTSAGSAPAAVGDLVDRLADYPSRFRFVPTNSLRYDDALGRARATVEMRTEMLAFLAWARTHGHPAIRPALPGDVTGEEFRLDPLMGNAESLDSQPLPGAERPFGRLIPDNETVKHYLALRQSGFLLIMLKTMLAPAEYARLVTDSPLVKAAAGKNVIQIYPYSTQELDLETARYLLLMTGIRVAFVGDPELRWLIANPGQALSPENQRRLAEAGGTLYTSDGYRAVYLDSERAGNVPATLARTLYAALRAAAPR